MSLQSLATQFLSLPGIVSCAATRLILRKVPGSNITSTMEDTMEKAQRAISLLNKDQLLGESRIARQVNALINLHITGNVPASIIPLLTLLQLKVNVLKAQIESLINNKVMECQGYGFEVETSGPVDPSVLALKTNEELRQLLAALRQKECDERVNVNFAPYHSQRAIAESRLNNVQAKIRQVEAEFDARRNVQLPTPTITSQIVQQFSEARCTFGYAPSKLFEAYSIPESPDPFSAAARNPRRLYIKPREQMPIGTRSDDQSKCTSTIEDGRCKDTGTGEGNAKCSSKDQSVGDNEDGRCTRDTCSCDGTSSEDSLVEDKKKLRVKIDPEGNVWIRREVIIEEIKGVGGEQSNTDDVECRKSCEVCEIVEEGELEGQHEEGTKFMVKDGKDDEESSKVIVNSNIEKKTEVEPKGTGVKDSEKDDSGEKETENWKSKQNLKITVEGPEAEGTSGDQEDEGKGSLNARVIKTADISSSRKTFGGLRSKLRKRIDMRRRRKDAANNGDSGSNRTDEINSGEDESGQGNGNRGNVQIVSMVTDIKYDRRCGDFGRWMIMNECVHKKMEDGENSVEYCPKDIRIENAKDENCARLLPEKIECSEVSNMDDEIDREAGLNATLESLTGEELNFTDDLGLDDKKVTEGFEHFPPLKQAAPNTRTGTDGIFANIFHQRGLEPYLSKIVCETSSYHRDTEPETSIASAIYSVIGRQLDSFGSLVGNISNFYSHKLWSTNYIHRNRENVESNKSTISRKDNWILLPTDIDHADRKRNNSREKYVSMGDGLYRVRKIRHSIIKNKGSKSYAVIGGSTSGQMRELFKNGLKRPSRVRRSFVIRSRLKNPTNFERECSSPFVILKRFKRNKCGVEIAKQSERHLKPSGKFCSLPDNLENIEASKPITLFHQNDNSDNAGEQNEVVTVGCVADSIDHLGSEDEQITNIHDYFAEQEQMNV
ncbi:hypothetical protein WN55_06289 [Dufourea novaeangliae]|uniref:Uncharacterized protein n=1 Tax=Dufourea novaeangliae TaxID=178035 RepID=A0A154PRN8_DUFNO|nr:hypothetical protein WN55_06289 [Dufourea novaeangliae]